MPTLSELHQWLRAVFGDNHPPQNQSSIASYRDEITKWLEDGLRPRIIFQKLNVRPGFTASESAVYRLCQKIKASAPPEVFVRLETAPGDVAQVDFGEVRPLFDPAKLKHLRLSGILDTLDVRSQQALAEHWTYAEFLERLLEDEVECRQQKQLALRVRRADLASDKTLETFDFTFNPGINRQRVYALATCQFIREKRNVLVCGPTGVGKTHLAQALAHSACRRELDVVFTSAPTMLRHLHAGRADGTYE